MQTQGSSLDHKNIVIKQHTTAHSKAFIVNKTLTLAEALPIADVLTAGYIVPGEFMGIFKTKLGFKTILEMVIDRAERQIIDAVHQEERYLIRSERRRPWASKTRRPFRGKLDKAVPTFSEKLKLAEEVASETTASHGPPWEKARTGRPPTYDPVKMSAALLVKGDTSFTILAAELKNIEYDATIEGFGRTPCPSEMHYAFAKISPVWLEKALALLDRRSADLLRKFDEPLDLFAVDGSALTGERLDERIYAMKKRLVRETYPYTALVRLPTNTVKGIKRHTNRISRFLSLLSPESQVLADPEFDVEENYRTARRHSIDLQTKQKEGEARRSYRKKARKEFDNKKYRRRKLGERFFGNVEARGCRCRYRKEEHRYKGALLIGCEHNILSYYKNRVWSKLFKKFTPIDAAAPPPPTPLSSCNRMAGEFV